MCRRLRMLTLNFTVYYVSHQELIDADALSSVPCSTPSKVDMTAELEVIAHVNAKLNDLPPVNILMSLL